MVLAPTTSITRKQYESHAHPFARVVRGLPLSWDSNTASATRPFKIEVAAWSPCNRFLAISPGHLMTAETIDSETLQLLQSLKFEPPGGEAAHLEALVFSPDSRMLTCLGLRIGYPGRMFVVSWELQTGGTVSVISESMGKFLPPKRTCLAYSTNGKMVGVLLQYHPFVLVFVCDITTGALVYSGRNRSPIRRLGAQLYWYDMWAHGQCFRYACAGPMAVTVWEITWGEEAHLREIQMLSILDDVESTEPTEEDRASVVHPQFLPASYRLSLVHKKPARGVQVWDAQGSKLLLHHMNLDCTPSATFSSDGQLFACPTRGFDIYLWKETPTGYVLHGKLAPTIPKPVPLLSPNGESIIAFGGSTVRLWHTEHLTTGSSKIPTGTPQQFANFILDLLPHRSLAVIAQQKAEAVTIIDLKSGAPQLTIDTGMGVYGLKVVKNTLVVMSKQMFATWDLPGGCCLPGASMGAEDSTQKIHLSGAWWGNVIATSISHDLLYIALLTEGLLGVRHLFVYDASTGQQLADAAVTGDLLWFTPDGRNIGCFVGEKNAEMRGITAQNSLGDATPICDVEDGRWGCPYVSSHGYQVTNDGWVLGPSGKRLLMLPPPWQSDSSRRVWNGRFLALLHGTLAEPIILELEP